MLEELGPYFAVQTHPADAVAVAPWVPIDALFADPGTQRARIAAVRGGLAAAGGLAVEDVEFRVAASVAQLGVVARLLAPVLGLAVLSNRSLSAAAAAAWWQPVLGGPYPLSVSEAAIVPFSPDVLSQLLTGPITGLVESVAAMSVSPIVLWGNVASAINGAGAMIIRQDPARADRVREICRLLLDDPLLRPAYRNDVGAGFQRRNCCLIYRIAEIPGSAYCGDCIHLLPVDSVLG